MCHGVRDMGAAKKASSNRPKLKTEKVEKVETDSIKAHPQNQSIYQDDPDDSLVEDIREAGIRQPIICDRKTRTIISGRRRFLSAKQVGLKFVPVIFRDYSSKDQIVESIIKANWYRQKSQAQILREVEALMDLERRKARKRQAEGGKIGGKYDRETSGKNAAPLQDQPVGPGSSDVIPGVVKVRKPADSARDRIGAKVGRTGRHVQRAIKVIEAAKDKHGRSWKKDEHVQAILGGKKSIIQASKEVLRTEREEVIKKKAAEIKDPVGDIRCKDNIDDILDESVDHVIVDPPYGIATAFNAQFDDRMAMESTFDDWDEGKLAFAEIGQWCVEWVRVLKTGGNIAVFTSDTYLSFIKEALRLCGCDHLETITWHKKNPEPSVRQIVFCSSCEYIVIGCKGNKRSVFNWLGQTKMHNFVEGPICSGRERMSHPTQKPQWLVEWLIERITNKGDLVLDNFAGVGTTAAACKKLKRQFIAIEKSRKYFNAIKVRLAS